MTSDKGRVLVVDDDQGIRDLICRQLESGGFSCEQASDGQAALERLTNKDFDVALIDIQMPIMDGIELLRIIEERGINTIPVVISVYGEIPNIVEAMKERGVPRLVSLTGAGVRVPEDRPKLVDRAFGFLLGRLQPDVLEDAGRHAEVIRGSGLDWVIVRAPRLTGEAARGRYRVGYVGKNSGTRISRADVADFMLEQITGDDYLHRMPMVSY